MEFRYLDDDAKDALETAAENGNLSYERVEGTIRGSKAL
jgi:hypothetical protein